jgi:hypothetical protein
MVNMHDNPLATFKPDIDEAEQRWQAYYAGDIIDRPPVCVTAPLNDYGKAVPISYPEKVFGDISQLIKHVWQNAKTTFWGGESVPSFCPSFGPDEIATFCGAELHWSSDSPDTNWSVPFVRDWQQAFPLHLNITNPLLQRQMKIYQKAAEAFAGKIILVAPDLHTNMDLIAAIRGPQQLCMDLLDCPELIDLAITDARAIFRELWSKLVQAGHMDHDGYALESHAFYSKEGSATLQCDFSIMMSPATFRRWVMPALEEEAEIVKHVVYHWDGPGALVHMNDLVASRGLHTLSFVPGDGHGDPVDYIDLLKRIQARGKSLHVWGTPDQCKRMHRELLPHKVFYCTSTETQNEAEQLLQWFIRNT